MNEYFAFELVTESSYIMWVDQDESHFDAKYDDIRNEYGRCATEIRLGKVAANSISDALNSIRSEDWDYYLAHCVSETE